MKRKGNQTMENHKLIRRIEEIERVLQQIGPPYIHRDNEIPCMFDGIDHKTNPVMGLSCPCPRCSPRC